MDLDKLIVSLHSAAFAPESWTAVVGQLAQALDADKAVLFAPPLRPQRGMWHVSCGVPTSSLATYARHFAGCDLWLQSAMQSRHLNAGAIGIGERMVDRHTFLRSEFYNDYLAPNGIDRFMNLVLRDPVGARQPPGAVISFYRRPEAEPFERSKAEILQRLAPHLILALQHFMQASELGMYNAVQRRALDSLDCAVLVLADGGTVLSANAALDGVVGSKGWLDVRDDQLVAGTHLANPHDLQKVLGELRAARGSTIQLTHRTSGRQALVTACPLEPDARDQWLLPNGAIGLLWVLPMVAGDDSVRRLAQLFRLTRAEERLLRSLRASENLRAAAINLDISYDTARAQLKAVLHKTGRRSQGQLFALLARASVLV